LLNYLEKHKKYLVYLPLVLYWMLILFLTSLPGSDLPKIELSDKMEHLLAFSGLGFLLNLSLRIQTKFVTVKKFPALFTIFIVSSYAALDELHQIFIPGRACDILDWSADTIGVLIGVAIMTILLWKVEKNQA
jgi:VanZ family protein